MNPLIIIFGITGDLSRRKLIPALNAIAASEEVGEFDIIGVSRGSVDVEMLVGASLASRTTIASMDLAEGEGYRRLYDQSVKTGRPVLIYLSVPPLAVTQIIRRLGQAGFAKDTVKLLLEKPFGVDETSAKEVIREIEEYFDDHHVYRIDHYLAKEMAQNIIAFRAGNALFSQTWNRHYIEKIEVIASETIGIEGRVQFYEQTGALRDVLQGHLMQLLSLVLMDIPSDFRWSDVPRLRTSALEQVELVQPNETVRAQYETYRAEVGNDNTTMETYVSATLWSHDNQWEGVPLILTTGKALDKKVTEMIIHFKKSHDAQANVLRFRIQPNEGVVIDLYTKKPGYTRTLEPQSLNFTYPEDTVLPEAYEQVLVDAIRDEKSVFASSEEIIESWRILQPLLDAWAMEQLPLHTYQTGASIQPDCIPQ